MDIINVFTVSLREGWNSYVREWKKYFSTTSMLFAFGFPLAVAAAFMGILSPMLLAILAIVVALAFAMSITQISLIGQFNSAYGKKDSQGGFPAFMSSAFPALKFGVFNLGLFAIFVLAYAAALLLILSLVGGVGFAALSQSGTTSLSDATETLMTGILSILMFAVILLLPFALVYWAINFLTQFIMYELAAGAGLKDAVLSSVSIVKSNLGGVFILGILFSFTFGAISIPSGIISVVASFLGNFAGMGSAPMGALLESVIMIPAYIYMSFFAAPFQFAVMVKYWRLMKGTDES